MRGAGALALIVVGAIYAIAGVLAGVGLWMHDWRCIAGGIATAFAAWIVGDVDSCIKRSSQAGDEPEWLELDLRARTLR